MARGSGMVNFAGQEVPQEAVFALRQLPKLDTLDALLEAVQRCVAGTAPTPESFKQLQRSMSLDSHTAGGLFSGMLWLVRTAMRSSLQQKALAAEFEDKKVPPAFVQPLVGAVLQGCATTPPLDPHTLLSRHPPRGCGRRSALAEQALGGLPPLEDLRWRLDVRAPHLAHTPPLAPAPHARAPPHR